MRKEYYQPPKNPSEQYLKDKEWLKGFANASKENPKAPRKTLIQLADLKEREYLWKKQMPHLYSGH